MRGKLKVHVLYRSRYPGPGQREEEGKRGWKIPGSNGEGPCSLGSAAQMLKALMGGGRTFRLGHVTARGILPFWKVWIDFSLATHRHGRGRADSQLA